MKTVDTPVSYRIVEFVGLPGSGKTTFHQRAVRCLARLGSPAWTPVEFRETYLGRRGQKNSAELSDRLTTQLRSGHKIWLRTATALSSLGVLGYAARQLLPSKRSCRLKLLAFRLLGVALENHRAGRRLLPHGHTLLLDEGLAQRSMTLFVDDDRPVPYTAIEAYARLIPWPDLLFHLKLGVEEAIERASNRDKHLPVRFQARRPNDLRESFRRTAEVFGLMLERAACSTFVVELETGDLSKAESQFDRFLQASFGQEHRQSQDGGAWGHPRK